MEKREGVQVKSKSNTYKRIISLLMILCIILSCIYEFEEVKQLKIEQDHFQTQVVDLVEWQRIIAPAIGRTYLKVTKQGERHYEIEWFWIGLRIILVGLAYLSCIKIVTTNLLVGIFYRIILYIHNKDGPKQWISPLY